MKAVARKPHQDSAHKKRRDTVHSSLKNARSTDNSHQTSIIQLKPICPCDGGCPRCAPVIQPKLIIGHPSDKYEQEADRVADEVMRMPEPEVQTKPTLPLSQGPSCGDEDMEKELIQASPIAEKVTPLIQRQVDVEEEEEEILQTKHISGQRDSNGLSADLQRRISSLRSGGQPLPKSVRNFFEPRFAYDFSKVRVHTDAKSAEMARSINARAFTKGKDIVFGVGGYAPGVLAGQRLLAHELAHVIQQSGAPRARIGLRTASLPDYHRIRTLRASETPALQRQAYRDCTPARTGRPGLTQADIDETIRISLRLAWVQAGRAVRILTAIRDGTASAAQRTALRNHFGVLTNAQIGTLITRFQTMETRLGNAGLVICNSAGSFYCRPPRGWCAYTTCPTTGGYSHLCPPFFQDTPPCAEPSRASIFVHEAARAIGACGVGTQPGAGYPPANAMGNVYSYSGFARDAFRLLMVRPRLAPPRPPRPRFR
jgi:hypothetical protein